MTYLELPKDITPEENMFLDLVKMRMLSKLSDRRRFIFIYTLDMGHSRVDTAKILGVNPTVITRHIKRIRDILTMYRKPAQ